VVYTAACVVVTFGQSSNFPVQTCLDILCSCVHLCHIERKTTLVYWLFEKLNKTGTSKQNKYQV